MYDFNNQNSYDSLSFEKQELMEEPEIAADGFTYEKKAILAWFEKHNVSPVTRQKLDHFKLTPNNTLRSAIRDWKSRVRFSNAFIDASC